MSSEDKTPDEDKIIRKLTVHKNLIGWLIALFKNEKIEMERTYGNDTRGDIFYPDEKDTEKIQKIVRDLNQKFQEK